MYDTHIQTTLSIRGHIVFIEYAVTPDWALDWWLNDAAYPAEDAVTDAGLALLETLLRTHEHKAIKKMLIDEFEARQYEEEQKFLAEADMQLDRIF
jgi:hypothetical protein